MYIYHIYVENLIIHIIIQRVYKNMNYGLIGSSTGVRSSEITQVCTLWSVERIHM